jgi:hypothetical protein
VEILDGTRDRERWIPDHVVGYLNGGSHWGWLDHPDVAKEYPLETRQQADELFVRSLRALADQWIDSGKDSEGIEEPLKRTVNKIPPGYAGPLFDVLSAWLGRNMPKPVLMRTGKIAVIVQSPNLATLDPRFYASECAIYWFKELLDSPGANRIARCKNTACNRYYLRSRVRRAEIKRGTYCRKCVGVGSTERTRFSRESRKRRLINLAADVWPGFKQTHQCPRQSDWVAAKINRKLGADTQVTAKWVNQNRKAIEKEVERREQTEGQERNAATR